MTLDFNAAAAKWCRILMAETEGLSNLLIHAFTTAPSVWIQNCAFLTMFLASCKILLRSSCPCKCSDASISPGLFKSPPSALNVERAHDASPITIVQWPTGKKNTAAMNLAVQPDSPRYLTRRKVRSLKGRSKSEQSQQRNEVGKSNKQRGSKKRRRYPGYVFLDEDGKEISDDDMN
ncbi:hypothetical protein B0H13DRAFT_1868015 [Mycena leptocephala]|nr:hypothetical protein B0H13DRAFT_1868015 [Mycena leptocephala]